MVALAETTLMFQIAAVSMFRCLTDAVHHHRGNLFGYPALVMAFAGSIFDGLLVMTVYVKVWDNSLVTA